MPRRPEPWYHTSRKSWFVTIEGVQHCLGPDKNEAFDRFYELMRQPRKRKVASNLLAAVCEIFLDWVLKHRSAATFEWYRTRLQRFASLHSDLRVAELKPFHVQQWDVTLHENACKISKGDAPQNLAALRNAIVSMLRLEGHDNIAAALRKCAWKTPRMLAMLGIVKK